MSGMKLRKALETDKDAISQLHIASIQQSCRMHYTQDQVNAWTGALTPAAYDHALKEKVFLVAEDSDLILLGLGMLDLEKAELSALYIHPDAAGQGIGSRLLQELERIAQQADIIRLTAYSTLNAKGFYQRRGYIAEEPARHDLPDGLKLECIRMTKELHPIPK